MDLALIQEILAIATGIVPIVLPTMGIAMDVGIMVMATKAAVNVVAMAAHPAGHIGIDHDEAWH